MGALDSVRQRIRLVAGAGGAKRHLMHPFNGRFHPIDHDALDELIDSMVPRVDVTSVDYVLGFPEGGSVPAYAFGRAGAARSSSPRGSRTTCRTGYPSSSRRRTLGRRTTSTASAPVIAR